MTNALAEAQPVLEQALPLLVAALIEYLRRRDSKRIAELERIEKELSATAERLRLKEIEREATVNKMRTAIFEARRTNGKIDPAKNTDARIAVQVCLDTLRASLWPRGDEKRGGGA